MKKNSKEALIIFAKNPVPGKVKTRLAADLGDDRAFEIYLKLLYRAYANTKNLSCDKFLFLSDSKDDDLFDENFIQYLQKGNDLGERMKNAFDEILNLGYEKILITGTDCPDLDENILTDAFEKLIEFDFILGPANDGGYYLLGMKSSADELFEDIEWSTEKVLSETIKKIITDNKSFFLLRELIDVDNISDLDRSDL